jgi:hypothetical protein
MGIKGRTLSLTKIEPRPASPHPIDHFMAALAEDQQERAVGIVLSGADHDGTIGLKEIKAAGGLVLVAGPGRSAQFPSMPPVRSRRRRRCRPAGRQDGGAADRLPAARAGPMGRSGRAAGRFSGRADDWRCVTARHPGAPSGAHRPGLQLVPPAHAAAAAAATDRLARAGRCERVRGLLRSSPDELQLLLKDFLISVTEFFRQPDAWQVLEEQVLPRLLDERIATGQWRAGVDARLCHGRGKLLDRHAAAGADRQPRRGHTGQRIRQRHRCRCAGRGPRRLLPGGDRRRDAAASAGSLLREAGQPLRRAQGAARKRAVCTAGPGARSAIFQARSDRLPQRADLPRPGPAEPHPRGLSLRAEPGRLLFLGKSESLGPQADLFEALSRPHRIFRRIGTSTRPPRLFEGRWSGPGGFLTPTSGTRGTRCACRRGHAAPAVGGRAPGRGVAA